MTQSMYESALTRALTHNLSPEPSEKTLSETTSSDANLTKDELRAASGILHSISSPFPS